MPIERNNNGSGGGSSTVPTQTVFETLADVPPDYPPNILFKVTSENSFYRFDNNGNCIKE